MMIGNLNNLISFTLLACPQTRKRVLKYCVAEIFDMILFGSIGDVVLQSNRYSLNNRFALFVVQDAVHLCILSWRVCIFFKEASYPSYSLITAATGFNVGLNFLLIIFDHSGLSDNNLGLASDYS